MGCMHSTEVSVPNLFQRNLCVHQKIPATDVYTVLGELGKGAFGIVEKVQHKKTKKCYAMKTVTFDSGHKRHEFEKEMDILRGLHHPNIVRMVETYEDAQHFFIIMELSTGGTLLDKVKARGGEFPEDLVKEIVHHLASVVQYLHSRFICHRDLKLENILIDSEELGGCIKLCDFGASTLFRMGVTMRKVLGSVVYMAPEVLEGNYTNACDLWSLGVIMYMLLSNTPPFHGATEDELIERIFEAKVTFTDPTWAGVSPEAKALIKKLLTPDPESRFTASQVLSHPWVKSRDRPIPPEVYDVFVPRVKAFGGYTPFQRAALVAVAFCIPSPRIRKHSDVYNELNVAHNGILTLQELQTAPALHRFSLDMEKIYQSLDQQHESGVNLLEFVAATLGPEDASNEVYLRSAFEILDRNDNDGITSEDLKELLGSHFDEAACHEMIKRFDVDKDGKVGFEDFTKMMRIRTHHSRRSKDRLAACSGPASRASSPALPPPSPSRRRSVAERGISSSAIDLGKPKLEHRHSAGSAVEADAALATLRAEHARQEEVAAELADVSKEEALQMIHSLHEDLKVTSRRQGEASESAADEEDVQVNVEIVELPLTSGGSPSKAVTAATATTGSTSVQVTA